MCSETLDQYVKRACIDISCSIQSNMMGSYSQGRVENPTIFAKRMLDQFDLILVTELLPESLVLLHMLHDAPFYSLPTLPFNENKKTKMPQNTNHTRHMTLIHGLHKDMLVHKYATERIHKLIEENEPRFSRLLALLQNATKISETECLSVHAEARKSAAAVADGEFDNSMKGKGKGKGKGDAEAASQSDFEGMHFGKHWSEDPAIQRVQECTERVARRVWRDAGGHDDGLRLTLHE